MQFNSNHIIPVWWNYLLKKKKAENKYHKVNANYVFQTGPVSSTGFAMASWKNLAKALFMIGTFHELVNPDRANGFDVNSCKILQVREIDWTQRLEFFQFDTDKMFTER